MKKTSVLILLFLLFSGHLFSQTFNNNDNVVNFGVGVGSPYFLGQSAASLPAVSASFEHGTIPIGKKIGVISFGGYAGFQHAWIPYATFTDTWNHFLVGVRAAFHFSMVKIENVDLYAGAMTGLRFGSHTWYDNNMTRHPDIDANMISDVFAGIRYYFKNNISVFGEAGIGISYITGGISLRL